MTAFAPIYNACLPAINSLANAVSKITGTIAVFVSSLFGKSISEARKEAQGLSKALDKTAKSGNKASDSIASFDKIDVLQEDASSGGVSNSSMDYNGEIQYSEKLLKFLNKIKDVVKSIWEWGCKNKKLVTLLGGAIATAFAINGIVNFISKFKSIQKILKVIRALFIKTGADGQESFNKVGVGTAVAMAGFVMLSSSITKLIYNWDNMTKKEKILTACFAVIGAAAIALGYAIATGISVATLGTGAIIAGLVALATAIIGLIGKLVSEEKTIKSVEQAQKDLKQAQDELTESNNTYIDAVERAEESLKRLEEAQKKTGLSGEELNRQVEQGILDYRNMTTEQREVYKAYLDNKAAQDNLKASSEALQEAKTNEKIASWENKLAVEAEKGAFDEYKRSVVDAFDKGELSAEEARDLIGQAMSGMSRDSQKTFMEDLPSQIKTGLDPTQYETMGQKLRKWFQGLWDGIVGRSNDSIRSAVAKVGEKIQASNYKSRSIAAPKAVSVANIDTASVPHLAEGTVIPPRHKFMAVLGDQRYGTNIEAPLETIKQAQIESLEQFMARNGAINNQSSEPKDINIVFKGSLASLVRILKPEIEKEDKRVGSSIIIGGA